MALACAALYFARFRMRAGMSDNARPEARMHALQYAQGLGWSARYGRGGVAVRVLNRAGLRGMWAFCGDDALPAPQPGATLHLQLNPYAYM